MIVLINRLHKCSHSYLGFLTAYSVTPPKVRWASGLKLCHVEVPTLDTRIQDYEEYYLKNAISLLSIDIFHVFVYWAACIVVSVCVQECLGLCNAEELGAYLVLKSEFSARWFWYISQEPARLYVLYFWKKYFSVWKRCHSVKPR